jgi:hypothetical protein
MRYKKGGAMRRLEDVIAYCDEHLPRVDMDEPHFWTPVVGWGVEQCNLWIPILSDPDRLCINKAPRLGPTWWRPHFDDLVEAVEEFKKYFIVFKLRGETHD